jgi:integrase
MHVAKGHIHEIKDDVGLTIAWRAMINHPTKLTKSGGVKRMSAQFAVGYGVSSAKAKKQAETWLDTTRQSFREGREANARTAWSLADAAAGWLVSIETESTSGRGKLRASSLTYYEFLTRCYIQEPPAGVLDIGALRMSNIDPMIVDQWKSDLIKQVSRSAARRALMTLKQIMRWSVVQKIITLNPATDVKLGSEKDDDDAIDIILERDHVRTILKVAKRLAVKGYMGDVEPETGKDRKSAANRRRAYSKWYPLLRLSFASGARTGEVLAARCYDFSFEFNTFRIERTLSREGKIEKPKTKKGNRTLAIEPEVMQLIQAYIEKRKLKPADYVFGSSSGKTISGSNLYRAWANLLELADEYRPEGLEPLIEADGSPITSPYHSRHYHASELLRLGVSLGDVSERLGHADTVITQKHYAHLLGDRSEASRQAAERFASVLGDLED